MEIWKDIEGYEGLYQVSNMGRVKSLERVIISKKGQKFDVKEKILNPMKEWKNKDYLKVHLCRNSAVEKISIHRLVAKTFIPNPDNLPFVNHKDENPSNNCVDNLEWCTLAYNNVYGRANKKRSESLINHKVKSKEVKQYTLDGTYIATYPSTLEAERQTNIKHIRCACNGTRKTAGGYVWKYS